MQLNCSHCQAAWDFSDRRPSYCPFCGKSLPPEAATQSLPPPAAPDSEAATLAAAPRHRVGDDADPEAVGGYRLLRVLGVGGMGKVYEAVDPVTGSHVALKLVSADYAAAPDAVERFRQEGRLASLIAHPRCVFVLAADEDAGRPYIVMELMPGDNLDDYVRRNGPQPPAKAVALILDAIEGLQEAHRVGVIHRDMKPSNCFFGNDGRLKVGDFGLSKSLAQGSHLTRTGSFLGTPLYASPEQVRGEALDAQTDVYSTAATLYFLLTGKAPFQSDNAAVTLARIAADPAPSMRTLRKDLPPALDAVVLRGLERDRKRRWHNLDEFAEALRPFLPGRTSLAGLGIRFGALMLDFGLLMLIREPVSFLLITLGLFDPFNPNANNAYAPAFLLSNVMVRVLYFGLLEGLWGWSVGKWLLNLRVRNVATGAAPGVGRGLLRAFIYHILFNLGALVAGLIVLPLLHLPMQPTPQESFEYLPQYLLLGITPFVGFVVGLGLMLCTMRERNGYRCLYEFLSGTYVVLLPRRALNLLTGVSPSQTLSQAQGVPEKIGPFAIRGAFRWDERERVLLGADAVLGRQVVLWLRPTDEPPVGAERREVNRVTRLRWLGAGRSEDWQWDAFVAPGGCPLSALIDTGGPLKWPRFQPVLKQLTDELLSALKEDTLPARLGPELVWVRADGGVVLLDTPFTALPTAAVGPTGSDIPEKQALALLGRVAVQALEGRAPGAWPRTVRAAMPLPAADALRKLLEFEPTGFRLREMRQHLVALQDKPLEVTRARRAGQVALMGLFVFLCFGCCLSPFGALMRFVVEMSPTNTQSMIAEESMDYLDTASLSDYLGASLNTNPLAAAAAVPILEGDVERRRVLEEQRARSQGKLDARVQWGGFYYQLMVKQNEAQLQQQRAWMKGIRFRTPTTPTTLRQMAGGTPSGPGAAEEMEGIVRVADYVGFLLGPALWVVWAFVVQGGLSYHLMRIAVVRRDGRLASRFRCMWRAFLVWVPAGALILLSYRLDAWYWSQWGTAAAPVWALWTATVLWYVAWVALVGYVVLALRYPTRGLHDYLAGTSLVPR